MFAALVSCSSLDFNNPNDPKNSKPSSSSVEKILCEINFTIDNRYGLFCGGVLMSYLGDEQDGKPGTLQPAGHGACEMKKPAEGSDPLIAWEVFCDEESKGFIYSGAAGKTDTGISCDVEEDKDNSAFFVMSCNGEEKARWAKAYCGTYAYDPEVVSCGISSSSATTSSSSSSEVGNSSSAEASSFSSEMPSSSEAGSSSSAEAGSSSSETPSSSSEDSSSSEEQGNSSSSVVIDQGLCAGFAEGTIREDHYGNDKSQFCDPRDGKKYVYVKIDTQTWMAENLNYNVTGSRCYGDNTGGDTKGNCKIYGRLYDWAMAMVLPSPSCNAGSCSGQVSSQHQGICPEGWYIPSNADWNTLMAFVHSDNRLSGFTSGTSSYAGEYLKATSGWNNYGKTSTDDYGFSALPGGYGSGNSFSNVGSAGNWWSTSEDNSFAYYRNMQYNANSAYLDYNNKNLLHSVRCVRD
jgi:uncharacterized protein (TIGR02145 family)